MDEANTEPLRYMLEACSVPYMREAPAPRLYEKLLVRLDALMEQSGAERVAAHGEPPPWTVVGDQHLDMVEMDPIEFTKATMRAMYRRLPHMKGGQPETALQGQIVKLRKDLDALKAEKEAAGDVERKTPQDRLAFCRDMAAVFVDTGCEAYLRTYVDAWLEMHPEVTLCRNHGAGDRAYTPVVLDDSVYDHIDTGAYEPYEEQERRKRMEVDNEDHD